MRHGSRLSALGSRLSALGSRLSALGSRLLLRRDHSLVCRAVVLSSFGLIACTSRDPEPKGTAHEVDLVALRAEEAAKHAELFRLACQRVDVEKIDEDRLKKLRPQYSMLKELLWRRRPEDSRCIHAGLQLLARLEPSKAAIDLFAFVEVYHPTIENDRMALHLADAIMSFGYVLHSDQVPEGDKKRIIARLESFLHGDWKAKGQYSWMQSTDVAMMHVVERELAKSSVVAMVTSDRTDLLEFVAGLTKGSKEAHRLPGYFVDSFSEEAQRKLGVGAR